MDQTINGNISNCIQYANSIGGTTYYNVCNGTTHWVPWGSLDWLCAIALGILILIVLTLMGGFIYAVSY